MDALSQSVKMLTVKFIVGKMLKAILSQISGHNIMASRETWSRSSRHGATSPREAQCDAGRGDTSSKPSNTITSTRAIGHSLTKSPRGPSIRSKGQLSLAHLLWLCYLLSLFSPCFSHMVHIFCMCWQNKPPKALFRVKKWTEFSWFFPFWKEYVQMTDDYVSQVPSNMFLILLE